VGSANWRGPAALAVADVSWAIRSNGPGLFVLSGGHTWVPAGILWSSCWVSTACEGGICISELSVGGPMRPLAVRTRDSWSFVKASTDRAIRAAVVLPGHESLPESNRECSQGQCDDRKILPSATRLLCLGETTHSFMPSGIFSRVGCSEHQLDITMRIGQPRRTVGRGAGRELQGCQCDSSPTRSWAI
jgi:hypothetical protein